MYFSQINAALLSIRNVFQKHLNNRASPKLLNSGVD